MKFSTTKVVATRRSTQGSSASRFLRRNGKLPGIVYGGKGEAVSIEMDHNPILLALKVESFHSSILDLEVDGKSEQVLLRDFQMHAYKPMVLHVDFQRVDETTRLRKKVPLHFEGEEASPAVKTDKCLVNHVSTELEIECLASQLPEFVKIDLSGLSKNDSLHASDLKLPAGIKAVKRGTLNPVIVTVTMPKIEEEIIAPVVTPAEKGKGKGKKDEKQNKK